MWYVRSLAGDKVNIASIRTPNRLLTYCGIASIRTPNRLLTYFAEYKAQK